ncbi:MAG: hypothetical protein V4733_05795 [Verrucomicrobiota bacterium]
MDDLKVNLSTASILKSKDRLRVEIAAGWCFFITPAEWQGFQTNSSPLLPHQRSSAVGWLYQ